jgi:hypothetical protein
MITITCLKKRQALEVLLSSIEPSQLRRNETLIRPCIATMSLLHDLFLDRWSPELRRAVIAVAPDFFQWEAANQLRYRVDLPEKDRQAMVRALLASIVAGSGSTFDDEDRLPHAVQNRLNELILPLTGIGPDAFFLNESFADGVTILDFPTLRTYDERDHEFQEQANLAENANYEKRPYLGRLYHSWARILIAGRVSYLSLTMAPGYLYDRISEATADELKRLIPHRHARGPEDGKIQKGGIRWDVRIDANGQEALLDELRHRVWEYERSRWRALEAQWTQDPRVGCYVLLNPEPGFEQDSLDLHVVFTDAHALDHVHLVNFMSDCHAIERSVEELHAAAAEEIKRALRFVAEQYEHLQANFDPKVTRLRKRRKVVLHPGALDDLAGFEED